MKYYLNFLLIIFSFNLFSNETMVSREDSLKIEKFKNHVNTLQYISRQNYNNEYFLDLALEYVDSIQQINIDNDYAIDIKKAYC